MSNTKRRGASRSIQVHNASDIEQTVPYNSVLYTFKPGETKDIEGQMDVVRDDFGRPTEEAMERKLKAPNKHATAEMIAEHLTTEGRIKGLCELVGDYTDEQEKLDARREWIKDITVKDKAIEARWRQRCLDSKNAGAGIPPMPASVEAAQDRLIKYKNANIENHKRFVVTVDGRSFDTKAEARKHIQNRYPAEAAEWGNLVNDTFGQFTDEEEEATKKKGLEALEQLASSRKSKESA